MSTTSLGITYPASTANVRLWEHFSALAGDVDDLLALPATADATGAGVNDITATSWSDLPTLGAVASITNPHDTLSLVVDVKYGAWMRAQASYGVRACPRISGSVTIAAGPGNGGAKGWGQVLRALDVYQHFFASFTIVIPASATAATATMQAYKENAASATYQVNYPTIELVPLYFITP